MRHAHNRNHASTCCTIALPGVAPTAYAVATAACRPVWATGLTATALLAALMAGGPPARAGEAVAAGATAATGGAASATDWVTRPGDTLERLVRRHHPHSPLTPSALVQAWVLHNPQAFPDGRAHRLTPGLRLRVPSDVDLARRYFPQALPQASRAHDSEGGEAQPASSAPHSGAIPPSAPSLPRHRWVRYP